MQIERFDDSREIVSIAVHVVSGGSLAGSAMTAPIMRDCPKTVFREEEHLPIPGVRAQRPPVRECYDRTLAPVLIIDFRTVPGFDCAHINISFLVCLFLPAVVDLHCTRSSRLARATGISRGDRGICRCVLNSGCFL